jgi:hypothetical protein
MKQVHENKTEMLGVKSFTLREEHRLRTFDNRMLRIFGPMRAEVTGGQRKLHSEEIRNLYSLPNIVTRRTVLLLVDKLGWVFLRFLRFSPQYHSTMALPTDI